MPNNTIDATVNESCGFNYAFSLWGSPLLSEFAASQQDYEYTENQKGPSSVYKEIEAMIVVENKDHYDWQEHQNTVGPK